MAVPCVGGVPICSQLGDFRHRSLATRAALQAAITFGAVRLPGLPAGRRQAGSAAVTDGDNSRGAMGRALGASLPSMRWLLMTGGCLRPGGAE
jgi:hypothetical protein